MSPSIRSALPRTWVYRALGATPRRSARRRMDRAPGPCSSSRARASLMISSRVSEPRGRVLVVLVASAMRPPIRLLVQRTINLVYTVHNIVHREDGPHAGPAPFQSQG